LSRPRAAQRPSRVETPPPPHDCRLTARCLREAFSPLRLQPGEPFSKLRAENSVIDKFFEQREQDPQGGEGGKRIVQVRMRPVFGLTFGRTRAATWFDTTCPPQGVVWLLDAEIHDERHKGTSDAYDLFAQREVDGVLYPVEVDYKWLELDRRRLDTESFADDVRGDARELVLHARKHGRATGSLAGIPARLAWEHAANDLPLLYVAVSVKPIVGARSGFEFPLTNERFLLAAEAVRQAGEELFGPEVLVEEQFAPVAALGGHLRNQRAFMIVFERA
jgi:hypothetical protein